MSTTVIFILCTASAAVGFVCAWAIAYPRGRAAGWVERYQQGEREKAARRDRAGRFIAIKGKDVS